MTIKIYIIYRMYILLGVYRESHYSDVKMDTMASQITLLAIVC